MREPFRKGRFPFLYSNIYQISMMLEKIGFQKNDANVELLRLVDIERQTLNPR